MEICHVHARSLIDMSAMMQYMVQGYGMEPDRKWLWQI